MYFICFGWIRRYGLPIRNDWVGWMLVLYVCLVPGMTSIDALWNLGKWPPPTIPSATSNCTSVRESLTCIHVLLWYCTWWRSILYNPPLKVMTLIFLNTTCLMQSMIWRFDSTNSPSELKRFHFLTGDRPWSARFSYQRRPEEGFDDVRNVFSVATIWTAKGKKTNWLPWESSRVPKKHHDSGWHCFSFNKL